MEILSHRGYWYDPSEQNTLAAFEQSYLRGFGTKTEVLSYEDSLYVGDNKSLSLEKFLQSYQEKGKGLPLALDIQSKGIEKEIKKLLDQHQVDNYFVFDFSPPEASDYFTCDLKAFTKQSDLEKEPKFYEKAAGVWADTIEKEWINYNVVKDHCQKGKQVCLVSPELHGMSNHKAWQKYLPMCHMTGVMLCTGFPKEAKQFFGL